MENTTRNHKPVTQQDEIVGHAVRAVYMYAGMTDIAAIYNDAAYLKAVTNIWNNMTERKMYLTGGIGAKHEGEAFGKDYELPNLTSYSETCASIGDVYWNNRLFMLTGDSKYYDIIERTLYNGLLSGISLDDKNFFYVNPLEADGKFQFNQGKCTRQAWFDCSCCPTNLIRFIPSFPGLIYASQKDTLYVNLYSSNNAKLKLNKENINIEQKTDYPWNGNISIIFNTENSQSFTLKLRIPGWAENRVIPGKLYTYTDKLKNNTIIKINGKNINYDTFQGYATITRKWDPDDKVEIKLPMEIRHVIADEKVKADKNLTALEYGPIVYCVEGIDNNNLLDDIVLTDNSRLKIEKRNDFLTGLNIITGEVRSKKNNSKLKLTAIPYFSWSNRSEGTMKVWLPMD